MTDKGNPAAQWHAAEVIIRADIYQAVRERGIDINDVCNRALADAVGIGYEEKPPQPAPLSSVIVAMDGGTGHPATPPAALPAKDLHPVINADDPAARSKVKLIKNRPAAAVRSPAPGPVKDVPHPAGVPEKEPGSRREKRSPAKRSGHDLMKMFFSSCITRHDEKGVAVSKDAIYEAFSRWCREHRIKPVPDRRTLTVALKNQFALTETVIGGIPSWTGICLK